MLLYAPFFLLAHPIVLKTILESGINSFDVASLKEIETIKDKDINELKILTM